jgi:hypothetical protein
MASSSNNTTTTINTDKVTTLRIYCNGTGSDNSKKHELLPTLYDADIGDDDNKLTLAGPMKTDYDGFISGLIYGGSAITGNRNRAREWLKQRIRQEHIKGNKCKVLLSGWSRGAVTANVISNEIPKLKQEIEDELKRKVDIDVKLFLIDPVAGPSNKKNSKMSIKGWTRERQQMLNSLDKVNSMVSDITVFYANDEAKINKSRKFAFKPLPLTIEDSEKTKFYIGAIPGVHNSGVKQSSKEKEVKFFPTFQAVKKEAQLFYRENGVELNLDIHKDNPSRPMITKGDTKATALQFINLLIPNPSKRTQNLNLKCNKQLRMVKKLVETDKKESVNTEEAQKKIFDQIMDDHSNNQNNTSSSSSKKRSVRKKTKKKESNHNKNSSSSSQIRKRRKNKTGEKTDKKKCAKRTSQEFREILHKEKIQRKDNHQENNNYSKSLN